MINETRLAIIHAIIHFADELKQFNLLKAAVPCNETQIYQN